MTQAEAKSNLLIATNEDTVGPYYPISLCDNDSMDLTVIRSGIVHEPEGEKIIINGCVTDINGELANGSLLEFWQPNAAGIYRTPNNENHELIDPWFVGYARHRTKDGNFTLTTIKPGSSGDRAPNITLTIFSDGIMRIVTQLFFEGEPANETDPLLLSIPEEMRSRLMIKKTDDGTYNINVIMAGDNETPFFDDLLS
ncbi:MAG: protocatechuate 3,4-dioxygenase subunit alpha [Kordiimonadaceae bacterium]|jgi:protocatechuate 3,4-dioxygenase alpha subunit|nr:protocatechuate 3,4-dioxygenase subunit alpha [Kordiimonadaceae bacterium]MBT6031166.1 protocatechuate 3,4-dioxygenase subunit alpha [Kordiimonadaceae bacterium]